MSEAECQAFVVKCVSHAIARDGSSGGCVRTVVINEAGVQRQFLASPQIQQTFGELKTPEAGGGQQGAEPA